MIAKLCYNMYNDGVESMEWWMSKHPHPDSTRVPSSYGRVPQGALFRIDGDTAFNGTDT